MRWDPEHPPSQAGRTIVVTGGNAGVGYFTAEQLARAGARVVIAGRSPERVDRALAALRTRVPGADAGFVPLDLTSLDSVRRAADGIRALGGIDALVNNAGLVVTPRHRQVTSDGIELAMGGNFVGHFALTALAFDQLRPGGRVVGLGSLSTRMVRLDADDLQSRQRYAAFRAYGLSKHAVHGFAFELDRRLRARGDSRASLLAHPGYATSAYAERVPGVNDDVTWWHRAGGRITGFIGQGKDRGAWPTVRAVADPEVEGGTFLGPSRLLAGRPVPLAPAASSASAAFGAHVWTFAERLTGVHFDV